MPPRKKATNADGNAAPTPTRSSARLISSAAAAATAAAPEPDKAPAAVKKRAARPAATSKKCDATPGTTKRAPTVGTKRGRDQSEDQDDGDEEDGVADEQSATKPDPKAKPKSAAKSRSASAKPKSAAKSKSATSKPRSKKARTSDNADDDVEMEDEKKMVTIAVRGKAPVDPESGRVHTHQVYVGPDGTAYDAMLNQTNIGANANKFYVIQLLHELSYNHTYLLYTRWGRVGERGSNQFKGPFPSEVAIGEFKKQFRAKTSVAWEMRVGMVAKKGKYTWLERDFSRDDEGSGPSGSNKPVSSAPAVEPPTSKLAPEVQAFCMLIFSTALIDRHLLSMNYDANKLPLGKLSKSMILSGFAALKEIADVIDQPTGAAAQRYGGQREALLTLSGSYYSIIPHDFGRQRPLVIDDQSLLKRELELVDALGDMEVASKLISASTDGPGESVHPLDARFVSLGLTSFEPIPRGSIEWDALAAYARDTHGSTHSHLSVRVEQVFRVERASETEAWQNGGFDNLKAGERLLLWHGSRTTNFAGILKQGLRIAPPEAPVTGYMFGKGVYFADMMSKSANYCYAGLSNNTGLLLLCEVAVKPSYELYNADYNADEGCRKAKKLATKGLGRTQPAKWKDAGKAMDNPALAGCLMPDGPGDDNADPKSYLQYNEYIVYHAAQIRAKYLLMVHM